jgi:hypothetical protein
LKMGGGHEAVFDDIILLFDQFVGKRQFEPDADRAIRSIAAQSYPAGGRGLLSRGLPVVSSNNEHLFLELWRLPRHERRRLVLSAGYFLLSCSQSRAPEAAAAPGRRRSGESSGCRSPRADIKTR